MSLALEASIGATGRATILAGLLLSLMNNRTGSIARLAGQNRLPEVSRPMLFVGTIFLTCLSYVPLVADRLRACLEKARKSHRRV